MIMEKWLSGRKTYLVAIGGVTLALYAWANGTEVPNDVVLAILAAMGVTLRAGVAKNGGDA